MNKNGIKDPIDAELSKTYFANNKKNRPQPGNINLKPKKKGSRNFFAPLVILIILGSIVAAAVYMRDQGKLPETTKAVKKAAAPVTKYTATPSEKPLVEPKDAFVIYNFEKDEDSWEIPAWAFEKPDHVARTLKQSKVVASRGRGSLEMGVEFPGNQWSGALTEIQQYLDLGKYDVISADIYLPPGAPAGLRAKLILTVGDSWKFIEMARTERLYPGKWTTLTARISDDSIDWRRTKVDNEFRADVRKVAIRVESNKAAYTGLIYIDNIRVYTLK